MLEYWEIKVLHLVRGAATVDCCTVSCILDYDEGQTTGKVV